VAFIVRATSASACGSSPISQRTSCMELRDAGHPAPREGLQCLSGGRAVY